LATRIIRTLVQAPGRCMTLANMYDRFPEVDDIRIDAILDDLSEIINVGDAREWLYLSATAAAEFVEAESATCLRLAEEGVT